VTNYTISKTDQVPDAFGGKYPGEMRFLTGPLGAEQVAATYRRMPQNTGGRGSYGHRHKTQEEVYFVISGQLQVKLNDEVLELGAGTAIRVAPEVWRSIWNGEPEDAELLIFSAQIDDVESDVELIEDFWPDAS
jgi:mannose-6-phosphate isomerase-like protein (cupin superfamily)